MDESKVATYIPIYQELNKRGLLEGAHTFGDTPHSAMCVATRADLGFIARITI